MAVYAVDFDGTLAVTRFPEIIGPRKKVVAAVKMLKASGHKIIAMRVEELENIMDSVVDIVDNYNTQ